MSQIIEKLYLLVHPLDLPPEVYDHYMTAWEVLMDREGPDPRNAIFIMTNGDPDDHLLMEHAQATFGDRHLGDQLDQSGEAKIQLLDDMDRAFSARGFRNEIGSYELCVSNHARRYARGIEAACKQRGLAFDPDMRLIACGRQWNGCVNRYPMFIGPYLGLSRRPELRTDLIPELGFPYEPEYRECFELGEGVNLYLFVTSAGVPMAQFVELKRAVWEPLHVAVVPIDPKHITQGLTPSGEPRSTTLVFCIKEDGVEVDTFYGCRHANPTVFGRDITYEAFRDCLRKSQVRAKKESPFMYRADDLNMTP